MLRKSIILLTQLCLLSPAAFAIAIEPPPTTGLTDQCVLSIRNTYRFYYHQVHPNPNPACHTNQKMSDNAAQEMQSIIAELKTACPTSVVAQVNQSLQLDTATG